MLNSGEKTPAQVNQTRLHQLLKIHFNEGELRILCSDLNKPDDRPNDKLDYEMLEGEGKETKSRALIDYLDRRGRIHDLVTAAKRKRPNASWGEIFSEPPPHPVPVPIPEETPPEPIPIEFVNRAYELDLICKPGAPRFTVVDGAAGFGKTYLLHKIKESYESNEREIWKAAYIDLKHDQVMHSDDSRIAWPRIADTIMRRLAPSPSPKSLLTEADEENIVNKLVPFLNRQKANILLLLDSVEVLPRSTSAWLKRLVYGLDDGLRHGHRKLRVVFSGRYVSDWGRGAPFALTTIPLSPFNSMAVREMVDRRANALETHPTTKYLDELTWQVLHISGGHPKGICDILDNVVEAGFIFGNIEHAFYRLEFQKNGQSGSLFTICIEPIIQTLIRDVDMPLAEVLQRMSPVRRFDQEILDSLLKERLITASGYKSSWELIRDMLRTHLIGLPTRSDPMFSDQIVRRMLAMQLQLNDYDFYRKMNAQAQTLFHERACKHGEVDTEVRRVAIIESLYHTLQLASAEETGDVIQNTLVEKLNTYLTGIDNPRDMMQLQDALTHDVELNDLINRRTGNNTSRVFLDTIEDQIWA